MSWNDLPGRNGLIKSSVNPGHSVSDQVLSVGQEVSAMPANTSAAHRRGVGTHPATRLVSVSGASDLATPRDVERQAAAGGFFWLDLENLGGELLAQFRRSL